MPSTSHPNRVTLKVAAGDEQSTTQMSSTWYIGVSRGPEVFILNRDAGGELAHISVHRDRRCHAKFRSPAGRPEKVLTWTMPDPLEGTEMVRLANVCIPHRGLILPADRSEPEDGTVLVPAPEQGRQVELDVFLEPGSVNTEEWPGQHAMGTRYVGRATLHASKMPVLHVTVVATYRPEGEVARQVSEAELAAPGGVSVPDSLRAVILQFEVVDGRELPTLTEMPVGHLRSSLEP